MNETSGARAKRLGWGLGLLGVLALAGCTGSLNLPVEGPDGSVAVVLSPAGEYDPFPEGGAVWVLDPAGNRVGDPFVPGEGQAVQVCDGSPEGWLLLVLDTDEYGFPVGSRLLEWAPGRSAREVFACPDLLLSPRYGGDERVLFLRAEDESATLWTLDRETGEVALLQSGVLAFLPAGDRTFILAEDGTFSVLGGEELPLQITCGDECQMTILFFSQVSLACDATGRYLAIALDEEPAIVRPEAERMPTLYLVDLVEERVERIATPALSPAFSPDLTKLAFVGQALDRPIQEAFTYDLASGEVAPVPGSAGALWVRWGSTGLLAAVGEAPTRLLRLGEGTWVDLIPSFPAP